MLTIQQPEIVKTKSGVRMQAVFSLDGNDEILWYEVDEKYQNYLAVERADSFLVGLFLLALKKGCDINVLAPVSERLFYTLKTYLLPLLIDIGGYKPIKISCDNITTESLPNTGAVGTGLSCGIDSFSTIFNHIGDDCPEDYRITHFTFFNVGSNGSLGGEKARNLFKKRVELVKPCASELGKELITIDSNISEILELGFYETHTYRNISACLVLQKLFKVYYYSSSYSLKYFELKPDSCGHFDIFNMSMLSTENISFFSTCPYLTRVEKTRIVSEFKTAYKFLNVCLRDGENCGECEKCVRTLFTLELFGKLKEFSSVFNLNNYYRKKLNYIAKVIAYQNKNEYMKEIYDEIVDRNFKIPVYSKVAANYLRLRRII
ncbi:hypothetical protein RCG23_21105 [Neobacillus sp. PS3-34]|uniref:hypothetical protein n=1 Tax=Neobacillus sp. PS3-34 TaxID=3070678 RepID=UPI0027E0CA61|nr:hypothetical protein [Neobacillus sp. PS3-34]WML47801.1 hypothetical protein RCG23_21105 [Neobacillus sp. PS3-34]